MKKVMAGILTGLLILTLAGNVYAVDQNLNQAQIKENRMLMQEEKRLAREQRLQEREEARLAKLNMLKEFSDELDQLSLLQRENLTLRIEISSSHQQIRNLLLAAIENGDEEALTAAREVRQELQVINEEMKALHTQLSDERQGFREAMKNKNMPEAQNHIDNMLRLKASINEQNKIKIDLLQRIITILS